MRRLKTITSCNIPIIYPHIIIRQEGANSLLFNSRHGQELELSAVETFIVSLCNGANSLADIEKKTMKRFNLTPEESSLRVRVTMGRLAGAWAMTYGTGGLNIRFSDEWQELVKKVPLLSAPKMVFWEVTSACNLHCAHCVTLSGKKTPKELTMDEAFAFIDQLIKARVFYLVLNGGEPFMRPDIMEILGYLSTKNIMVKIDTNGTLLNDQIIGELSRLKVGSIQVSIDGIGEEHDTFRGKKGTFSAACRNIRLLVENGIQANILMSVTSGNLKTVDRVIDLAFSMGCRGISINPFVPAGRGKAIPGSVLDTDGYRELYRTISRRAKELEGRLYISTEIGFAFSFEPRERAMASQFMGCGIGYDLISIGPDGTAYPCSFMHDFPLGNIRERSLQDIWDNSPGLEPFRALRKEDMHGDCRDCANALRICTGGCRARAYYAHGDPVGIDPACILRTMKNKRKKCVKP